MNSHSKTPILKKIGIKEDNTLYLYNPCQTLLDALTDQKINTSKHLQSDLDYMNIFSNDVNEL